MREFTQADPYVWFDELYEKLRIEDRVVANAVVTAYGVGADGHRDVRGIDVVDTESKESWTAFLRSLKKRRLASVKLAISDVHEGVKAAIATVLQGASWQRCTVRFGRNILAPVPQNYKLEVAASLRSVFTQFSQVNAARTVQDIGNVMVGRSRKRSRSSTTNPIEHLNREIRRRTRSIGIFSSEASALRIITMVLIEQREDWMSERRYMSPESLKLASAT